MVARSATLFLGLLAGCASRGAPAVRQVSLSEFARPQAAQDATRDDAAIGGGLEAVVGSLDPQESVQLALAIAQLEDPEIAMEAPGGSRAEPGERYIVDSLVGEVNGRPVYADEFLVRVEDRLIAVAQQYAHEPRELRSRFQVIIAETLKDVIENELILAEAEASLSEQQQMGLFALLRSLQEEKIRQVGGGARVQTEQYFEEQGEGGLDAYLELEKNRMIVWELYRRRIQPRVIVSWRDIEREYQRQHDRFNPPRTVTLARIRLRTQGQAEQIARVKERLAAGDSFAAIATDLGIPDRGVWETFKLDDRGLAGLELAPELKSSLAGLEQGQTTPPIEVGVTTVWLNIVEFRDQAQRSIYDPAVQRLLTNSITGERRKKEWDRFTASLMARGVYDELDAMSLRLYQIALARYAPE